MPRRVQQDTEPRRRDGCLRVLGEPRVCARERSPLAARGVQRHAVGNAAGIVSPA